MWLVAGAARVIHAGTKYDHMLVLEGKQGLRKSTTLRTLATFGDEVPVSYFTDGVRLDMLNNPKSCQYFQKCIIVEFAELDGLDGIGETKLRAWITQQEDTVLKNYATTTSVFPRHFIAAGSTNESNWLKDKVGNRRYHPVSVITHADIDALERDRDQLWAEAVHLYRTGYSIYLSDDDPVYLMAQAEQMQRFCSDPIDELFATALHDITRSRIGWLSYSGLWTKSGMPLAKLDSDAQRRMRNFMKAQKGWEYRQTYALTGNKQNVWVQQRETEQEVEFD